MSLIETIGEHPAVDHVKRVLFFGNRQRGRALRKLATYMTNNMQQGDALSQMIFYASDKRKRKPYPAVVYQRWYGATAAGGRLGDAMEGYVPEVERQIIVAAERFGNLGQGILDALEMRDNMRQIRNAILGAVTYPAVLVMMFTAFFVFLSSSIFPGFRDVLPEEQWPSSASSLEGLCAFVYGNIYLIYGGMAVAVAWFWWSLPRWKGSLRMKLDRYFPYAMYRIVYGTVFLLSLSGYIKAGMNPPVIINTMMKTAKPWYAERLYDIGLRIREGRNIGDALAALPYQFPTREIVEDLRVYAKHKSFEEVLEDQGRQVLADSIGQIKSASVIFRNAAVAGLFSVMFWFTSAMFDFNHTVTSFLSNPH